MNKKPTRKNIKSVLLVNPLNHEKWICDDYTNTVLIDGEEYVFVCKPEQRARQMKMRKSALKKLGSS